MNVDIEHLAAILRDAAKTEILPRFRRLEAGDVREKTSAVDLVTEADEASERFILARCRESFPDAVFVGEEGVAADPELIAKVAESDLAIVVDPIDGTANFAAGAPMFGVMAAVVRRGETVGGVIYDPLGDDVMLAEKGAGAHFQRPGSERKALRVAPPAPIEDLVGSASTSFLPYEERRRVLANLAGVRILANYRTAAQEYRLAASGFLHFQFYLKLMPWDHLAGALMVAEAGGHVRRLDGSAYEARHTTGGLLTAPDEETWAALRELIGPVASA